MSYIGNQPTTVSFLTDQFSGNGSTTAFTLTVAPASSSSILVAISGVLQDPTTYSVSGTTLTFTAAPPSGSANISVRFLGIPASGVSGSGGGQFFGNAAVKAIAYNSNTISENLTVTTGNNGYSAGPITVSPSYAVTVQAGARWVII